MFKQKNRSRYLLAVKLCAACPPNSCVLIVHLSKIHLGITQTQTTIGGIMRPQCETG